MTGSDTREGEKMDCLACGEKGIPMITEKRFYKAAYGPKVIYTSRYSDCPACLTQIDRSAPEEFPRAVKESERLAYSLDAHRYGAEKGDGPWPPGSPSQGEPSNPRGGV